MSNSKKKDLILVVGGGAAAGRHLSNMAKALDYRYKVEGAPNGAEGTRLAKKLLPHLVIRDNAVPGGEELEWCRAFKNDDETGLIPLLLVYARGYENFIVKGYQSGVDDCMVRPFSLDILRARVKNLVGNRRHLLEKVMPRTALAPSRLSGNIGEPGFMEQLHSIMEANLSNPVFSVEKLCQKLNMSRASMYRKILVLTGESPQMFIRSFRLKRAVQLLENNYGNVTEVCFRVGFSSTPYFTKCFKEKFHRYPKTVARRDGGGLTG